LIPFGQCKKLIGSPHPKKEKEKEKPTKNKTNKKKAEGKKYHRLLRF